MKKPQMSDLLLQLQLMLFAFKDLMFVLHYLN